MCVMNITEMSVYGKLIVINTPDSVLSCLANYITFIDLAYKETIINGKFISPPFVKKLFYSLFLYSIIKDLI